MIEQLERHRKGRGERGRMTCRCGKDSASIHGVRYQGAPTFVFFKFHPNICGTLKLFNYNSFFKIRQLNV